MFIRLKDGHFLNLDHVVSVEEQTNGEVTVKLSVPRQHTDVVTETFKGEAAANLLDALEGTAYAVHREPLVQANQTPTIAAAANENQTSGSAAGNPALTAGSLTGGSGQTGKEGGDLNL